MYDKIQNVHLPVVCEFIIWLNEPWTKAQSAVIFHEGSSFHSQADIAVEFSDRNDHGRGGIAGTTMMSSAMVWHVFYTCFSQYSDPWRYENRKPWRSTDEYHAVIPLGKTWNTGSFDVIWLWAFNKASSQRSRILYHGGLRGLTWGSGLRGVDARNTLVRVPSRD